MPRAYSMDLRERLVAAVAAGESCRSAARRFGVSASAAVKWSARARSEGCPAPRRMGGYRRSVLAGERDWLLARLEEKPDLTIRALVIELADRGVKAGDWSVWAFLKREGLSFKKNAARRRTGSAGRGEETGAVEAASAPA